MSNPRNPDFGNRFGILILFLTSLVACYFVADYLKDSVAAAYSIHESSRVSNVRIEQYLGEKRHRYRRSTSSLHEYRASGDGKDWIFRLPNQVSEGSTVLITYSTDHPETFVLGRHTDFFSVLSKKNGGILGLVFFGGCFAATALFGYGVYSAFHQKGG